MNVGTSKRSACSSVGHAAFRSVTLGNQLLERTGIVLVNRATMCLCDLPSHSPCRTCLMVLLVTSLGGHWSVEQPSGSLLEFYPSWRAILRSIFNSGGPDAAWALKLFEVASNSFILESMRNERKSLNIPDSFSIAVARSTASSGGWPTTRPALQSVTTGIQTVNISTALTKAFSKDGNSSKARRR